MEKKSLWPPGKRLWAYAYDISLPDDEEHLWKIQDLLDNEHSEAKGVARTWAGRVVVEPQILRILVVSDTPEQDLEVNRRIEAELSALGGGFELTVPLAVMEDAVKSLPMNIVPLKKPA